MNKRKKKLPTKLSALLRLAVEDAQICEKTPGYALDMRLWHEPSREDEVCRVCMAGAVMAVEQQIPWDQWVGDPSYIERDANKLQAINLMRIGGFADAYAELMGCQAQGEAIDLLCNVSEMVWVAYTSGDEDLRAPWPVYLAAADKLEKAGL